MPFKVYLLILSGLFMSILCFGQEKDIKDCKYAREQYLLQNPDVKKAGSDPWIHYNHWGKIEGRKWPDCDETKGNDNSQNQTATSNITSQVSIIQNELTQVSH